MAQRLTQARARMGGVSLAALMIAAPLLVVAPQDASAQAVRIDGNLVAGSPNVTSDVSVGDGQTLTVDEGASITPFFNTVVGPNGAGADTTTITVNNAGTIESPAGQTAITTDGSILLTNSGIISGGQRAIFVDTITSLINSGSITSSSGTAIWATGMSGTITSLINSGSITTSGGNAIAGSTISSLMNSGTITSSTNAITGGTISSLINSGTITGRLTGIVAGLDIASLINSGSITSSSGTAIWATGLSGTITSLINSGSIRGSDRAIWETGAGDTQLTLLEGSLIEGTIDLGGGINTLNVGSGLSFGSTFDTTDAPVVVGSTSGQPFSIRIDGNNTEIAVIDTASLGLTDEGLADLTGGIFGVLSSRQSGFGGSGSGFAAGDSDASSGSTSMANARVHTTWNVWGEVFGSYRVQDGSGNATDTTSSVGGLVIGADGAYSDTLTLGGFLGGAWGQSETDSNTQETDTTSIFAGVYGALVQPGVTYDFALVGGHSRYDRERQVANNLVAGGLETARADYNGWFLSPELTVRATHFQSFEPFVTLRYAGLFLDDVTETGTAAPLTLESQTLHLATGRLGITLPYEWMHGNGSETRLRLTGGVEARSQFGGTTQRGVLLGQSIAFEAGDTDAVLGGFVGLDVSHQMSASTALYASGEALVETGYAMQLSARAGVRMAF